MVRQLLPRAIGQIVLPPWVGLAVFGGVAAIMLCAAVSIPPPIHPYVKVAMVGNSMMYYNDFPRFMGAFSVASKFRGIGSLTAPG